MRKNISVLVGSLFFSLKLKWFVSLYSLRPVFLWNTLVSKFRDQKLVVSVVL